MEQNFYFTALLLSLCVIIGSSFGRTLDVSHSSDRNNYLGTEPEKVIKEGENSQIYGQVKSIEEIIRSFKQKGIKKASLSSIEDSVARLQKTVTTLLQISKSNLETLLEMNNILEVNTKDIANLKRRMLAQESGKKSPPAPSTPAPVKDGQLRLVGGRSKKEGRLEVYHDGEWGTVCGYLWGMSEASAACRELGYAKAREAGVGHRFGVGNGKIWLISIHCDRGVTDFPSCRGVGKYGPYNALCSHENDAYVVCQ